jgi:hypothetical protein
LDRISVAGGRGEVTMMRRYLFCPTAVRRA